MTPNVVTVGRNAPFKAIAELLNACHISAVPVVAGRQVVGMVSEADLLRERGDDAAAVTSAPVVTIQPETTLTEAARLMQRRHVKRLPVLDSEGRSWSGSSAAPTCSRASCAAMRTSGVTCANTSSEKPSGSTRQRDRRG